MKTKKFFLVSFLLTITTSIVLSQNSTDKYGSIRTDGFDKITPRAFWTSRPEAKSVYYWKPGTPIPDGVDEIRVTTDTTFIRFWGNENNGQDINYIGIPAGQRLYRVGVLWYLAKCGNQVEFFDFTKKTTIVEGEKGVADIYQQQKTQLVGNNISKKNGSTSSTAKKLPKDLGPELKITPPPTQTDLHLPKEKSGLTKTQKLLVGIGAGMMTVAATAVVVENWDNWFGHPNNNKWKDPPLAGENKKEDQLNLNTHINVGFKISF